MSNSQDDLSVKPETSVLEHLARRYVWWTDPKRVVNESMPRLIASVMELGTWDDAETLRAIVGHEAFEEVALNPPQGIVSARSLAFWYARLGLGQTRMPSKRQFG
jgi:hypothetical protein